MKVFLPLERIDKYFTVHFSDPTFDAVSALEEIEHVEFGVQKHDCVSSCVLTDWDQFIHTYYQFRARINFEKRENYRFARGGTLPGRSDTRVLPDIKCGFCGVSFRPASYRDKFCSQKCSAARFIKLEKCKTCGREFEKRSRSRHGYCSVECGTRGRTKIEITHEGKSMTIKQWSSVTGISAKELRRRMSFNWSAERMLTTPVKSYKRRVA